MHHELPEIGIVTSPRFLGINDLTGKAPFMEVLPYNRVFTDPFETDVHFVTYTVVGHDTFPRLNKIVLPKIRAQGGEVLTTLLAFDYDNPEHAEWTSGEYDKLTSKLFEMDSAGLDLALGFTHFYTTRHGCRIVYVLDHPIPVEEAEGVHKGIVKTFSTYGLELDRACSDWTRLFRAPFVVRDDKPTWDDEFFEEVCFPDKRLDPRTIVPESRSLSVIDNYAEIEQLTLPQPSFSEAKALLKETNDKGKEVGTAWYKEAKRRLKGRNCYPCLFEHRSLAALGERDTKIQSYIGEATALLYHVPGSSPELVYALFLPALEQLEPDDGTPDWTMAGWLAVLRWWSREEAKYRARKSELRELEVMAVSISERIVSGMREWCSDPNLHGDTNTAIQWAMEHLIACTPNGYFLMTASGRFDVVSTAKATLAVRIRELGMEPVITLDVLKDNGNGFKKINIQDVIDDHGTVVSSVEGCIGDTGGVIRDMGGNDATMVLPLFHRKTDLKPEYSTEVDTWLTKLGGENAQRLKDWIALSLDFEGGPICALSLAGPQGCGKKLLMSGLAECINTEAVADSGEFGRFQSGLLRTPFLQVNEGFHSYGRGARDPADTFRHLVSGDPLLIEQKFRDPVLIRNPLRIVFAANNLDVIQVLTGHRDLSPDDRAALALRLFHFAARQDATDWLRMKGGLSHTARAGSRWIRGDDGAASDYIVAKHFLWLYTHAKPQVPKGNRLLMEGEMDAELLRHMTTRSGSAPDVVETLIKMIENKQMVIEGLHVSENEILVTTSAIVEYHRRDIGRKTNVLINHKSVGKVLKGLVVVGSSQSPRIVHTKSGSKQARWREIDVYTLLEEAIEHGYPCTQLQMIVAGRAIRSGIEELPVTEGVVG